MSILNLIKKLFGKSEDTPNQPIHSQITKPVPEPVQSSEEATTQPQPNPHTQAELETKVSDDHSVNNSDDNSDDNSDNSLDYNETAQTDGSTKSVEQKVESSTPPPLDDKDNNLIQHVIIGSGPAGVVTAESLRKLDPNASITLISDEPEPPYSRMAIPYFLEENISEEGAYLRKTNNYYQNNNITLVQDRVTSIDSEAKTLTLKRDGSSLNWDKLLIASGSHPITPPIPGIDNPNVSTCWTLEDARNIVTGVKPDSVVVQIGAGFIGCIILESLVKRGATLTVVEMGDRMVPHMLDQQCGTLLKRWCENKGVTVLTGTQVSSIESQVKDHGEKLLVNVSNGDPIVADFVISATGVRANIDFLQGSGIKTDEGILVNQHLETNIPNIFAAGDVAQGLDFSTGNYTVQAIQPTASEHGLISSKNMVNPNSAKHQGAVLMNVLATLGLISVSYGLWQGIEGGESSELVNTDKFRYIRLQFDGDKLIGANTLGITQNIGAIRGLIQSKIPLGIWKARLMNNPLLFMEAYVSMTGRHS